MNVVQFSVEPLLRVAQAFPATPRIMAELGRLLRDSGSDLKEIAALVKTDSTLAARLLRVANSAAISPAEHVASIEDAAALIGLREIHRLVGAVAVDQFSLAPCPLYGLTGKRLRENALLGALLMEELAVATQQDPHAAYTAGLFRSLGKLVLETLAAEAGTATPFRPDADSDLVLWEKRTFGIAANEASAIILQRWRFPEPISRAIAGHYGAATTQDPLTILLNLAAKTAEAQGYGLPGEQRYLGVPDDVYRRTGIDGPATQRALERAAVAFERLNRMIG